MKVLLSIKPNYVNEIVLGKKKYEYRKRIFKKDVDKVIIYASQPVGLIIGEFTIEFVLSNEPQALWNETKEYSGISLEKFKKYFEGHTKAYAIKIKDFKKYEKPINPYIEYENFNAPQSYMYIA